MAIPFTVEQFHGVFREIVPLLWCLVGAQAVFLLGVQPDLGLVAPGLRGIGLLATVGQRHRRVKS